jgi:FKBP-type peptidyl-prolyl cis-trans isomerase SlyD
MKIEKNTAVTVRFKLPDLKGKLLEDGNKPVASLRGGYGNVLPEIEEALEGQSAGDQVKLDLQPQEAFGVCDENLVQTVSHSQFPPGAKVGGQLQGRDGEGQVRAFTVKKIKGREVFLDGNHPLAGTPPRFAVTVISVHAASEEEIAHGHVHGDGGHYH